MDFFEQPILNSPYNYPKKHWELDESGQPTQSIHDKEPPSSLVTPVPRARSRQRKSASDQGQLDMIMDTGDGLSSSAQEYNISGYINEIRELVDQWRRLPNERDWKVTAETAQLLHIGATTNLKRYAHSSVKKRLKLLYGYRKLLLKWVKERRAF